MASAPYEPRITPQAGTPLPLATPQDFGAGVADTAGAVAQSAEQGELRAYEIQRQLTADSELSRGSAALAQYTANVGTATAALRQMYTPDHVAQVTQVVHDQGQGLFDDVTQDKVRLQLQRQLQDVQDNTIGQAQIYSLGEEAKITAANAARTRDTLTNSVATAADPFPAAKQANDQYIDYLNGLTNISDFTRDTMMREAGSAFALASIKATAPDDPKRANEALHSGLLSPLLTASDMEEGIRAVKSGTQYQIEKARQDRIEANRVAKQQQDDATSALAAIQEKLEHGDVPPLAQINQTLEDARNAGVKADVQAKYQYLPETAARAQRYAGMPTTQLQMEALQLQTKRDAGQLDPSDTRALDQIDKTVQARVTDDGKRIKAIWDTGPGGQEAVLDMLHKLPLNERLAMASTVDPKIAMTASLPAETWQTLHDGAGVRKDRPHAFMPDNLEGKPGDEKDVEPYFEQYIGRAQRDHLGENYRETLDLALNYYVGSKARMGGSGTWDPNAFNKAVRVAYGGTKRADGSFQGGIDNVHGNMTELPDGWNADEFDRAYSRQDFAGTGAIYSNKKPVDNADILNNFHLVVDRTNDDHSVTYSLQDAIGKPLMRDDAHGGGRWRLVVKRSPTG
jgi:hypothetical protein